MRGTGVRKVGVVVAVAAAVLGAIGMVGGAIGATTPGVGRQPDGSVLLPTGQRITPAGRQVEFAGRPVAVAVRPGGHTAAFLNGYGTTIVVVDIDGGKVVQNYDAGGASSFNGLAYSPDGNTLLASLSGGSVAIAQVATDGTLSSAGSIALGTPNPYPGGIAVAPDGHTAYVALSATNALGVVDLVTKSMTATIPVGNVPFGVVVDATGTKAWVSNEGGRPAKPGDFTNDSFGTPIVADPEHGGTATGSVSLVDIPTRHETATVNVGLHPTALTLSGDRLIVANTNSDTLSIIDTATGQVSSTVEVRPFPAAPEGSAPNGLAVLPDGRLAVSLGRNNAVAVVSLPHHAKPAALLGLLPTAAYPAGVAVDPATGHLLVANDKGVGTLGPVKPSDPPTGHNIRAYVGSASILSDFTRQALVAGTARVAQNNAWDHIDRSCPSTTAAPVAIPAHIGEPSLIKHVVYVVKENRTYDQVLGDDPRGNGDPTLVQFGEVTTPNQHEMARRFPLLDNFYDSGNLSADGHQWVVQANAPDYVEKAFPSFVRSYPASGLDALAYLPTGFIWENAVHHGKTVRVFGEYGNTDGASKQVTHTDVPSLQPLLDPNYPAFLLEVPDQQRAELFLHQFAGWVASGSMPDLTILYLPNDHTAGTVPTYPSPNAEVADNDAAFGQVLSAISTSSFWKDTAVFSVEDDSQAGLDHVDAHRSPVFVASPYAPAGLVDSTLYTQVSVVRTVEQILGLPPMNQMDLAAAPMRSAFVDTPDVSPFVYSAPSTSTTATNPAISELAGMAREWAVAVSKIDLSTPDAGNKDLLNRDIWYSVKGFDTPYPGDGRVLHPSEVDGGRISEAEAEDAESGRAVADDIAHARVRAASTAARSDRARPDRGGAAPRCP